MVAVVRKVAAITEKGQTTVPKSVREALGVAYGGRIVFSVDEDRRVTIEREDADDADPVIDSFLDFLAKDMKSAPARAIADIPHELRERIAALTAGMDVDLDEAIDGAVDL